jgi:hypothetical protein
MTSARPDGSIDLSDRLLAEAVRFAERDGAALHDEPAADKAGRAAGGDLETRIVRRAAALSAAPTLRDELSAVHRVSSWIVLVGFVLAIVTGAGAARAALGTVHAEPVNFFWVLASLLGVQSLLLVGWFVVMTARPGSGNVSPLGGAVLGVGRWVAGRVHQGTPSLAAVHAVSTTIARGAIGRWTLSSVSHAMWAAGNVGCVALLIVLLSTREYRFNWETTILSPEAYQRITRVLAVVPGAVGFAGPTADQIAATESGAAGVDPGAARAWSGLLVGSIVVYGLAPRLLLVMLCAVQQQRAQRRFRLNLAAPGYELLRRRLMPDSEALGTVDDDDRVPPASAVATPVAPAQPGEGPPVVLGLEIDAPVSWPPDVPGVTWNDLGIVDGRDERHVAEQALGALAEPPCLTVVVASLTTTPDRGVAAAVGALAVAAGGPVALLLTGGAAMRRRMSTDGVEQRVADWRRLADELGMDSQRVLELDLDHATDASVRNLAALIGDDAAPAAPPRRLESAFGLIAERAGAWNGAPSPREQDALHRDVAAVYRDRAAGMGRLLGMPDGLKGAKPDQLAAGAQRILGLLPDRLRSSPKWLAAGALSGALGCVAVGALLAPAALAALPAWAISGASIAGILQLARGGGDGGANDDEPADRADAVRAAALLAMLLELQGRDEVTITRVLDGAIADDEPADDPADDPAPWLDELRHRFDVALAREAAR